MFLCQSRHVRSAVLTPFLHTHTHTHTLSLSLPHIPLKDHSGNKPLSFTVLSRLFPFLRKHSMPWQSWCVFKMKLSNKIIQSINQVEFQNMNRVSRCPVTTSEKQKVYFLKVELLIHARPHGVLWDLCSNNRSSLESDGTVAQSDLCYVTCGPRNICSSSSLDMCGMSRSFPRESKLFACFNHLSIYLLHPLSLSCQPSYFSLFI